MSAGFLLDVNVMIAMAWPAQRSHGRVQQWLARHGREGWATCPFTQAAFVRILSNPAFSPNALTPADAMALLRANLGHPAHRFWPDDITLEDATKRFQSRIVGHQQVTDAYLLGLALHRKGKLVTLDQGLAALVADEAAAQAAIVTI